MCRMARFATTGVVLLALASCEALFTFNLFDALDTPPAPTAADYDGAGGLEQLGEDLASPAMVEALASDPALVDAILSSLATDYLGGDPPANCSGADAQQAAILYADLNLKTSEGEALVNNVIEAVLGGIDPSSTVAEILAGIVPPEALASATTFAAMVTAMLDANDVYLLLGGSIDADDDGVADGTLPPDALPGDIAQKAVVAYVMAETVAAVLAGPPALANENAAIAEMYVIATGGTSASSSIAPDPLAAPPTELQALLDYAAVPAP